MTPYETPLYLRALLFATIAVVGCLGGIIIFRRYTGVTRSQAALMCLAAFGLSALILVWFREMTHQAGMQPHGAGIPALLLPWLVVPFATNIYRKWIGSQLTEAEKLPDMDGVRAWLGFGNLICAVLIPVCAWQVFRVSLPAMFALTFGLLLAYPIFNLVSAVPQPAPAGPAEDLSNEREKVLQLLEAGKITADESAELLNALGQSVPHRPLPASEMEMSPQRKIVLLGAALLLLGFFLPWFKINLGQVMNETAGQMKQMMGGLMPDNGMPQLSIPQNNGMVQVVQAGNIPHGLGWWILALGIGAAVLPFFATNLKADLQKKVILAALAVGAFLLIYLLSDALRYASIGVILAVAGCVLEFVGTLKERPGSR